MTRGQRHLGLALEHVRRVEQETPAGGDRRRIYGNLCHTFPILVRTNGLCQALAFVEEKARGGTGDRQAAYADLRAHVAALLGIDGDLMTAVRDADLTNYLRHTRTVLAAWVYYKRFAVSILRVQAGEDDDGAGAGR